MLLTVAELRRFVDTEEDDQTLEIKLQALELLIRGHTNNNFQAKAYRVVASAVSMDNAFIASRNIPFRVGDTLEITGSELMPNYLVTVASVAGNVVKVNEDIVDESSVIITKVVYPMDVKMGAIGLMKWEAGFKDKIGLASESISRHSVTYSDMSKENTLNGFPRVLLGFLRPYIKARF